MYIINVEFVLQVVLSIQQICQNTTYFAFFTPTRRLVTPNPCSFIWLETPMFTHSHSKNGPFRGRTLRFRTDDSPKHGDPTNRDHAGFAALNDDTVVANAALGERDGAAQRWAITRRWGWIVSRVHSFCTHVAICAWCGTIFQRVPCSWARDQRLRAASRMDVRIAVTPNCAVACIRKRLQAADIENGRTTVSEQTKTKHRLMKQMTCGIRAWFALPFSLWSTHLWRNQHLSALNKACCLEWCTSMLQRLGAAKRPRKCTSLCQLSNPSPSPACSNKRCAEPSKSNTSM